MKDWVIDGFEYDAWANRLWAEALQVPSKALEPVDGPGPWPDFPADPQARIESIFGHILWAQKIWLERCGNRVSPTIATADSWISELKSGWLEMVAKRDPDEIVPYKNTAGQPYERPFGQIARHVITHGVYHRGQLRELFGAAHPEALPSTDLITFYFDLD